MRSPVRNQQKKEGGSRFTLTFGVGLAIVFVTLTQVFFIFFKTHHVQEQSNSIVTYRNTPVIVKRAPKHDHLTITANARHDSIESEYKYNRSVGLPSFSRDKSDFILSSIIERTSDSWTLHITSFFLSKAMTDPDEYRVYKANMLHMDYFDDWKQHISKKDTIQYHANGARSKSMRYSCRVQVPVPPYELAAGGYFMPNRQTLDSNSNRRLDVLRCPLAATEKLYRSLAASLNSSIRVELLRENVPIIQFEIPLSTRRAGYLLSGPPASSSLDVWRGLASASGENYGADRHSRPPRDADVLHVCTARPKNAYGMSEKIYQYMEFTEHHTQLGASHVYMSVDYSWGSSSMRHVLRALRRYIDSGKLTVTSEAEDVNMVSSSFGIAWDYVTVRNFHINSCLYMSKGAATYLAVWDVNEFFVPKLPHTSIVDVIRSASNPHDRPLRITDLPANTSGDIWRGGPGWADGDAHPYCYLSVGVRRVLVSRHSDQLPGHSRFMANMYENSPVSTAEYTQKTILPTRQIFQGALQVAGGCRLDTEWTGCADHANSNTSDMLCFSKISDEFYTQYQFITRKNPAGGVARQALDDVVFERDRKKLSMQTDGYLIDFAPPNEEMKLPKNDAAVLADFRNEYVERYSAAVRSGVAIHVPQLGSVGPIPEDQHLPVLSNKWKSFAALFPKPSPKPESELQKQSLDHYHQVQIGEDLQYAFDASDIFKGSADGPYHFSEEFARGDILQRPAPGQLPAFASDYSDVGLGSLIEREHDSWNLFVTTFFLQHWMLWNPPDNYGMFKVSDINRAKWERASSVFNKTQYERSGARKTDGHPFICRLRVSKEAIPYDVIGQFMPNSLTPDRNANRRVDIMRCKMRNSMNLYRLMPQSNESVFVEILRDNIQLFEFSIPWKTRRTGYSLSSPDMASSFDAWKAFNPTASDVLPGSVGGDRLYMCVPGVESALSQLSIPRYAEFVQHHFLLGVEHMFVGGTYAWNGQNMARLLAAFHSYIDDGLMTISSLAGDNIDLLYSILGASLDRDNAKVMHVNMCLYLSRGVADYVAVWDTDEYFIPRLPHHTIMDVIRSAEAPEPLQPFPHDTDAFTMKTQWTGGRGWADGHGHPFCYLTLSSDCIFRKDDATRKNLDRVVWVGEEYSHRAEKDRRGLSFQKSILPTRIIYQAGLHVGAACRLPPVWAGCNDSFCYTSSNKEVYGYTVDFRNGSKQAVDFSFIHKFDAVAFDKDAKRLDPATEALIYHIQIYRVDVRASDAVINSQEKNEYATRFFPAVMSELKRRGIYLLATLPENIYTRNLVPPDSKWIQLWPVTQEFILSGNDQALDKIEPSPSTFYGVDGQLPHFVQDHSDVVLGAVVERVPESYDLYLVTFFMAHEQLSNFTGKIKNAAVRPDSLSAWMKATRHSRGVNYTEVGERNDGHNYTCLLSNSRGGDTYAVQGRFLPNELTPDVNANKRLDILRCPIRHTQKVYDQLRHSDDVLTVKIYRDSFMVTHFSVPWKTRRAGYMLSDPPGTSLLDPWKGASLFTTAPKSATKDFKTDNLHMCVPGVESAISKRSVALYVEFMQHHFNLGVEHMYAAATYRWGGVNMERFLGSVRSFIDDGLLSVTSAAGDEDLLYGTYIL